MALQSGGCWVAERGGSITQDCIREMQEEGVAELSFSLSGKEEAS